MLPKIALVFETVFSVLLFSSLPSLIRDIIRFMKVSNDR